VGYFFGRNNNGTSQNPFPLPFSPVLSPCLFSNEGAKKQPQFTIRPAIQGFSRHKDLFQFLLACSDFLL
jgi:hypothetical protein